MQPKPRGCDCSPLLSPRRRCSKTVARCEARRRFLLAYAEEALEREGGKLAELEARLESEFDPLGKGRKR